MRQTANNSGQSDNRQPTSNSQLPASKDRQRPEFAQPGNNDRPADYLPASKDCRRPACGSRLRAPLATEQETSNAVVWQAICCSLASRGVRQQSSNHCKYWPCWSKCWPYHSKSWPNNGSALGWLAFAVVWLAFAVAGQHFPLFGQHRVAHVFAACLSWLAEEAATNTHTINPQTQTRSLLTYSRLIKLADQLFA